MRAKTIDPSLSLSKEHRKAIRNLMISYVAKVTELPRQWADADAEGLRILDGLTQAARDRGLFCHLGDGGRYGCTGRKAIVAGKWEKLGGDHITSIAITTTGEDMGKPDARYHCVVQQPPYGTHRGRTWHSRIVASNPPKLSNTQPLIHWFNNRTGPSGPSGVAGLWAVPGMHSPKEVWIYIASARQISQLEIDANNKLENRGWRSPVANAEVVSVRAVDPKALAADPDGELPAGVGPGIKYGGLKASPDIFVFRDGDGRHGHLRTPWTHYKGIGVDKHFVWVFGSGGFACATHVSVMKCLEGQLAKPHWIEHYPNQLLYKNRSSGYPDTLIAPGGNEPAFKGMIDLCPCDDGTLSAIASTRTYKGQSSSDATAIYTTSYSVDIKARKIAVDTWLKFGDGHGEQIIKLPIFCWSLFDSLKARLRVKSLPSRTIVQALRAASPAPRTAATSRPGSRRPSGYAARSR